MYPVGSIVRSLSGRDRKRVFMIVDVCSDSGRVLIADGTLHKLASPKKKNLSHIAVLATAENVLTSIPGTDDELNALLTRFENEIKDKI